MKVTFRQEALDDLERIRRWIGRDNPGRALTFVRELRARAARLSDMPLRFPVAYESSKGVIRKLTHGNYLLFYRTSPATVEVIAVRHARQDALHID